MSVNEFALNGHSHSQRIPSERSNTQTANYATCPTNQLQLPMEGRQLRGPIKLTKNHIENGIQMPLKKRHLYLYEMECEALHVNLDAIFVAIFFAIESVPELHLNCNFGVLWLGAGAIQFGDVARRQCQMRCNERIELVVRPGRRLISHRSLG